MPVPKKPVRMAATSYSGSLVDEVAELHRQHIAHEKRAIWYFLADLDTAGVPEWFIRQTMVSLARQTGGALDAYSTGYIKAAILNEWTEQNKSQQSSGVKII